MAKEKVVLSVEEAVEAIQDIVNAWAEDNGVGARADIQFGAFRTILVSEEV